MKKIVLSGFEHSYDETVIQPLCVSLEKAFSTVTDTVKKAVDYFSGSRTKPEAVAVAYKVLVAEMPKRRSAVKQAIKRYRDENKIAVYNPSQVRAKTEAQKAKTKRDNMQKDILENWTAHQRAELVQAIIQKNGLGSRDREAIRETIKVLKSA